MSDVETTGSGAFCWVCTVNEVSGEDRLCPECSETYFFGPDGTLQLKGLTEVIKEVRDEPKYLLTVEKIGSKGWRVRDLMPMGTYFARDFSGKIIYWPTKELAVAFLEKIGVRKADEDDIAEYQTQTQQKQRETIPTVTNQ